MGKKQEFCWSFIYGIATGLSFALLLSSDADGYCKDGYGLNYSLPMFNVCRKKLHPNGSMVQYIPKLIPATSAAHGCTTRNNSLGIPPGHRICRIPDCDNKPCENGWCEETMESFKCHCSTGFEGIHCSEPCLSNPCPPGGTCEETDKGFSCTCPGSHCGDGCEYGLAYRNFIHSLTLVGGSESEGRIVITSRSRPTTYVLIHQINWSRNASRLACKYLGYEDVYATVGGDLFEMSSLDNHSEAVTVRCPSNVTHITNCWYEETAAKNRTDVSVAVVCCTLNICSTPRGSPVGLESGKVPDSDITVSSELGPSHVKQRARLNSPSAWIPEDEDEDPWLQIKFNSTFVITAITTQGWNVNYWVTSYTVSSSMDGVSWTNYQDINTNTVKVYTGNYDQNSCVVHTMSTPVECRLFRIYPKTAYKKYLPQGTSLLALRLELTGYGPLNDALAAMNQEEVSCARPIRGEGMGVEDGRIPDSSLTSSSTFNARRYPASHGRLNGGSVKTAWIARNDDKDKWVKIDLGKTSAVTGVIVQGRYKAFQWVTSVKVSYSLDNVTWTYALEPQCGEQKVYAANYIECTPETILFPRPITSRYVRIHPLTWQGHQAMRYEVLGIAE